MFPGSARFQRYQVAATSVDCLDEAPLRARQATIHRTSDSTIFDSETCTRLSVYRSRAVKQSPRARCLHLPAGKTSFGPPRVVASSLLVTFSGIALAIISTAKRDQDESLLDFRTRLQLAVVPSVCLEKSVLPSKLVCGRQNFKLAAPLAQPEHQTPPPPPYPHSQPLHHLTTQYTCSSLEHSLRAQRQHGRPGSGHGAHAS